jgi:hypothetical protein
MTTTKPTIASLIDQREFCKLFKIKIPVHEHFDYYIDLIQRSGVLSNVYELIEGFNDYSLYVQKDTGYSSVVKYKLDYALPKAVDFVKSTKAYSRMEGYCAGLKTQDFRSKDERKISIGIPCLSLDIKSANFSSLVYMDGDVGHEFEHEWNLFLTDLDIHPFLARSKSFRQYVFGNTNPKMFSKVQRELIWDLKGFLQKKDVSKEGASFRVNDIFIPEDHFRFVSHDELVISLDMNAEFSLDGFDLSLISDIEDSVNIWSRRNGVPIRLTPFIETKDKEFTIREISDLYGKHVRDKLMGAEGSKIFLALKKHILNEPVDRRDLLFKQNDSISQWVINEEDEIVQTITVRKRGFHELVDEKFPEIDEGLKIKFVNLAIDFFQNNTPA